MLFVILSLDKPFLNAQNCIDNYQCEPGQYCKKQEGDCFGWGICSDVPSSSYSSSYDIMPEPVCGCNDITYPDSREAAKSGVNVVYSGTCQTKTNTIIESDQNFQILGYPYFSNQYSYYPCYCYLDWQNWSYYHQYWEEWDSKNYPFLQNWFYRFYPYLPYSQSLRCYCYGGLYGGMYGGLYGVLYGGY